MPTYEYECKSCRRRFDKEQSMSDAPLAECPKCHGPAKHVISGGIGIITRGSTSPQSGQGKSCSLESLGRTCCGRSEAAPCRPSDD